MGYLRFSLALMVLMGHVSVGWSGIGSRGAVQAFFVLSGLYMAAVYSSKYSLLPNGAPVFYINRFLRLFPTYLLLLCLTGACYLAVRGSSGDYGLIFNLFTQAESLSFWTRVGVWFSAITLAGQDFISVHEPLHYMLPVRQSWSIATELLFYLSVPLLFRYMTWKRCLVGFAICMAIKFALLKGYDWRYAYFLPVGNFGYFLLGYALHGLSSHPRIVAWKEKIQPRRLWWVLGLFAVLAFMGKASFELDLDKHPIMLIVIASLSLLTFEKTPKRVDQFLGNISYGVYLNHFLLLVLGQTMGLEKGVLALWTVSTSLFLAFLMEKVIQAPIDRYRRGLTALPVRAENR